MTTFYREKIEGRMETWPDGLYEAEGTGYKLQVREGRVRFAPGSNQKRRLVEVRSIGFFYRRIAAPKRPSITLARSGKLRVPGLDEKNKCGLPGQRDFNFECTVKVNDLDDRGFVCDNFDVEKIVNKFFSKGRWEASCEQLATQCACLLIEECGDRAEAVEFFVTPVDGAGVRVVVVKGDEVSENWLPKKGKTATQKLIEQWELEERLFHKLRSSILLGLSMEEAERRFFRDGGKDLLLFRNRVTQARRAANWALREKERLSARPGDTFTPAGNPRTRKPSPQLYRPRARRRRL